MTYDKYFTMLQHNCIRYDKHLKHKLSSTASAVHQHDFDGDSGPVDDKGTMLMEVLHWMALILYVMTSTTFTVPISIGNLRLCPEFIGLPQVYPSQRSFQ